MQTSSKKPGRQRTKQPSHSVVHGKGWATACLQQEKPGKFLAAVPAGGRKLEQGCIPVTLSWDPAGHTAASLIWVGLFYFWGFPGAGVVLGGSGWVFVLCQDL